MELREVLVELERYGNSQTKKVYLRHGAREPLYGVKIGDLKKIVKKIKKDHNLALELYDTGNSDAMYLAGLIADPGTITKEELRKWVRDAYWYMLAEYTVPGVASESPHGWALGLEWINTDQEMIEAAGWSTLARWISNRSENEIHIDTILEFMNIISDEIHSSKNRVRYTMNGFIISVGSYIPSLSKDAIKIARKIGKVHVEMGETACKVPLAEEYIEKVIAMKRKKKPRDAHRL